MDICYQIVLYDIVEQTILLFCTYITQVHLMYLLNRTGICGPLQGPSLKCIEP